MVVEKEAVLETAVIEGATRGPGRSVVSRVTAVSSPVEVMMNALANGMDPASIEKMLDLQERWERREAEKAFNAATAAFRGEKILITKGKRVSYENRNGSWTDYTHAELSDVVDAVSPALARHGLSFRWDVKQSKDWVSVTCTLKHALGHSESVEMGGPPDSSNGKNTIQGIASTVSYLQRYTLKAINGVAEKGDDDDGRYHQGADQGASQSDGGRQGEMPEYPQDAFEKNLPGWRKLVVDGKRTADEVIAFVSTKGVLSDEQKQAIRGEGE